MTLEIIKPRGRQTAFNTDKSQLIVLAWNDGSKRRMQCYDEKDLKILRREEKKTRQNSDSCPRQGELIGGGGGVQHRSAQCPVSTIAMQVYYAHSAHLVLRAQSHKFQVPSLPHTELGA